MLFGGKMKRIFYIIFVVTVLYTFAACSSPVETSKTDDNTNQEKISYKNISPKEAKERLDSVQDIILLDVRTVGEYKEKHIPGSLLVPVDVIEDEAQVKLPDKNAIIFVYCRSGNRSVTASKALVQMGYRNVYNLGGIIDWPYETE